MFKCPGCKSESLLTRQVGVLFLLCPQCQDSWRITQLEQPRAERFSNDLESLVDSTKALVKRARESWQALLELSLDPPSRLPMLVLPARIEPSFSPVQARLWQD